MALTLADEFIEERTAYYAQQDLDNRIEVKIRSRAIGYDHYQPKPLVNAIAGGALGLLLGLGLVLALTWMESDLRRSSRCGAGVGRAGVGGHSRGGQLARNLAASGIA